MKIINQLISKTQLLKIGQSGQFLSRILGALLETGLSLAGNVLKLLAKSVLIPLRSTAVAWATNAAIHEKMIGSGVTTLIISNKEINEIIKVVKSFKNLVY